MENKKELTTEHRDELISTLKARFEKNMQRHNGIEWTIVQQKLMANTAKLWSLGEMERTGGEPDVVGYDDQTGDFIFYDCSAESPKGRRSLCYDHEALESRKEHKPDNNALDMADSINRRPIPWLAATGRIRYKNFELGENTCWNPPIGRRTFLRSSLQPCFCISQWRRIVLCCQGIPRLTKGLRF